MVFYYTVPDDLPALTADNVTTVCSKAGICWTEELCAFIFVPWPEVEKIRATYQELHSRLRASVGYWLKVDPAPSWRRIIAAVDYWNEFYRSALSLYDYAEPVAGM